MSRPSGALERLASWCLDYKLVVVLGLVVVALWGVLVAPFDWRIGLPRDPVPVDALPDTGENQQIVFTDWPGRSPQDVEDQITYPLGAALLGVPGVHAVRSTSMSGFSSVHVIFDDDVDFYWARSRLLEKLASLPPGTLPDGANPTLGPDATALGQVFWYTLESVDEAGAPTPGFDLHELRAVQDWHVRFALAGVEGVSEVSSVGGFVQEYQVDVDPDLLRTLGVTLEQVFEAVRRTNAEVGARTIEINQVEYLVRGLGYVESVEDIEHTVISVVDGVPVTVGQVATVHIGPALRRGALDRAGAEAVGGVVVVRYGANPLQVIDRVKAKIAEIEPGLPRRVLSDGTEVRVSIEPFYDRTRLIHETLDTLRTALTDQVLVTVIVVLVLVAHVGGSLLVSGVLPLAVLLCFVGMRYLGVDANVVALSGIAIAIGTMVDMGVVMVESILRHLRARPPSAPPRDAILAATAEVGGAVLTSVLTTVVSFLPVFAMQGEDGKLFRPLAQTKTLALVAAIAVTLIAVPPMARALLVGRGGRAPSERPGVGMRAVNAVLVVVVGVFLARHWQPLGPQSEIGNLLFTGVVLAAVLGAFALFHRCYEPVLRWCLAHKLVFSFLPLAAVGFGLLAWLGFDRVVRQPLQGLGVPADDTAWQLERRWFPGLKSEFMPRLDEGSFLLMPVTSDHASIGEAIDVLRRQDEAIAQIPEVEDVVGKIGRVESALDPAPVAMVETVITYKPEYGVDEDGEVRRQWRSHIRSPEDIWETIAAVASLPGTTAASMLQPIGTRQIMLQTGMRSPFGVVVSGPDLDSVERTAIAIEGVLKEVDGVKSNTVRAHRIRGKPYLEIDIDREAIARHGLTIGAVQRVIDVAVGGRHVTTVLDGRARYPVRVRYLRELRDSIESLEQVIVAAPGGAQLPLGQLARLRYTPGPQSIRSENTFLVTYVTFDKTDAVSEAEVVELAAARLDDEIAQGGLMVPAGVSYRFAGRYESQLRAEAVLRVVLPLALVVIFLLLYLHFRSTATSLLVFSGVLVAWAGGFVLLWLYSQPWFLDVEVFGVHLRELFGVKTVNMSVAVWVGFLALFGIATDDGVLLATYLRQRFAEGVNADVQSVRDAVVEAGKRRIRACLMTSATTVLALLPVLTSTGRGADVMVPMAIPTFGGMLMVLISVFVVPTLYCWGQERRLRRAVT